MSSWSGTYCIRGPPIEKKGNGISVILVVSSCLSEMLPRIQHRPFENCLTNDMLTLSVIDHTDVNYLLGVTVLVPGHVVTRVTCFI